MLYNKEKMKEACIIAYKKARNKAEIEVDTYWAKAVLENSERVTPDGKITLFAGDISPTA